MSDNDAIVAAIKFLHDDCYPCSEVLSINREGDFVFITMLPLDSDDEVSSPPFATVRVSMLDGAIERIQLL